MAYGIISMNLLRICFFTGASLFAVGAGTLVWRARHKNDPELEEMLRRKRINAEGRITDGTVLEVQEVEHGNGHPAQVVVYSYDVRGVQYECAQDVTPLHLSLHRASCCTGDANIKYDPRHPGNSIVAAESWCGLRISAPTAAHTSAD
jgi:hypothetical protein